MNDLIKNPLVLGIVAAVATYSYLYWDQQQKQKQHPKMKLDEIGFITPLIVGLLVFVIAHNLFGDVTAQVVEQIANTPKAQCNTLIADNIVKELDSQVYHLVGKNSIRLPSNADVFIDLGKF